MRNIRKHSADVFLGGPPEVTGGACAEERGAAD